MSGIWIGGHHLVFDYIPENQIWISNKLPEEERDRVILHEYTERALMKKGMAYNLAHIEALKNEGNITEAEIKEREYIRPEDVNNKLDETYSKNDNGTWQIDERVIRYDDIKGIIYVNEGDKVVDQLLVRSMCDLESFINKLDQEFQKVKE